MFPSTTKRMFFIFFMIKSDIWEDFFMDMNLQNIWPLSKPLETGSFTKAALALRYSNPASSRMIADLERMGRVPSGARPGRRASHFGWPAAAPLCKKRPFGISETAGPAGRTQRAADRPDPHRNLFSAATRVASRHHPGFSAGLPGHRL